ncbi:MAG: bifunctional homocysteine S-methyltransferase/methylenetetrahydrofolate reductase [Fimbriimonadaceae bacterium]
MKLRDALLRPILIGDGANGTELAARGFLRQPYDLANLLAPEIVRAVHQAYVDAGADFIETNTYSAGRFRIDEAKIDIPELNFAGAALAKQAAGNKAFVLGAVGPVGKPIAPIGHLTLADVKLSVREQAEALVEGGVDGFILETYIDMAELIAAIEAIQMVTDLPIIASKAYIEDGEMLGDGLPARCTRELAALGIAAVGANCIVGPQRMLDLVRMMAEVTDLPILAMPTPGLPQLVKGVITYDTSPEYFARAATRLVEEGAKIIGGCCGTTPEHIRALKSEFSRAPIKVRTRASVTGESKTKAPLRESEPSELARKLGRKFVTAVEVDLPRGLIIDKLIAGAKSLKVAGADCINISDGARARLRMNPMSVCALLMRDVGIDTTMHFSCRDRNLLAVQADLLGVHALGIRNILAVTGDPANIGDYPSATSVFDIDSIGLIRILSRFNEGIDLAGYSVGVKCAYTIACAYNPSAIEQEGEFERLQRKVEAGAHVIYTQPVFDRLGVETAVADAAKVGLPVLVGIMPLRSQRHCEFMHNEVPGVTIPERLRAKFANTTSDEEAQAIGFQEAMELALIVKEVANGLYLMPPANNYTIAEEIIEVVAH